MTWTFRPRETSVPFGYCACGCGKLAPIAPNSCAKRGMVKGQPLRMVHGHARRNTGTARVMNRRGYVSISKPDHPNAGPRGRMHEHVYVASQALGKAIPRGAVVHHINEVRWDNRPENLVICQDEAYHKLLHSRMRARSACGSAGWVRCRYCRKWDARENLKMETNAHRGEHPGCRRQAGAANG